MSLTHFIATVFGAYLLGSIPTGFLVAKAKGVDIRGVGSGNIGATNVFRTLGKRAGILVLLADAFKGFAACRWMPLIMARFSDAPIGGDTAEWLVITAGISVILGHNYTCWLRFKGGKGVATSAGVLLAMIPVAFGITFGIWLAILLGSRYVSLASVLAAVALPISTWAVGRSTRLVVISLLMGLMVIVKHRANIRRLLNGSENRFGSKKKNPVPDNG